MKSIFGVDCVSMGIPHIEPSYAMATPSPSAFTDGLTAALAEATKLRKLLEAAFPAGARAPEISLAGRTVDQKIALGNRACEQLHDLAMGLAPETTLDRMDQQLPTHTESLQESQALFTRLGARS